MRTTAIVFFSCGLLEAQAPTEPPILMRLIREPMRAAASQLSRAHANAHGGTLILGMSAVTGAPETWFLELHDSYAGIEAIDQSIDSALVPSSTILLYLPGLSYRADLRFGCCRGRAIFRHPCIESGRALARASPS